MAMQKQQGYIRLPDSLSNTCQLRKPKFTPKSFVEACLGRPLGEAFGNSLESMKKSMKDDLESYFEGFSSAGVTRIIFWIIDLATRYANMIHLLRTLLFPICGGVRRSFQVTLTKYAYLDRQLWYKSTSKVNTKAHFRKRIGQLNVYTWRRRAPRKQSEASNSFIFSELP